MLVTFDDGRVAGDGATDLQMEQQGGENLVELAMVRESSSLFEPMPAPARFVPSHVFSREVIQLY